MNKKQKTLLWRIIIAAIFWVPLFLISEEIIPVQIPKWALIILFLIPYLLVGYDILRKAFNNQDTVLVTDNENEDYIKTYCPNARSRIIHGDYAAQFVDALLELLGRVLV